jgi:hypothetical protein
MRKSSQYRTRVALPRRRGVTSCSNQVEHVVQIDVPEQRREPRPLHGAEIRLGVLLAVYDTCPQPLADEPPQRPIRNPSPEHPPQLGAIQAVEEGHDVCLENPDHLALVVVQAKARAAAAWCTHATMHEFAHEGKGWRYLLIPHDAIAENMTIAGMAAQYVFSVARVSRGSQRRHAPMELLVERSSGESMRPAWRRRAAAARAGAARGS